MPELPEVETVRKTLIQLVKGKTIKNIKINYPNMIVTPSPEEFKKQIINQSIIDIKRRGKLLIFELNDYYLLSHLRMEGRYYLKDKNDENNKHEHIIFTLDNNKELRYIDTRKFGRMYLYTKEEAFTKKPYIDLGLEPWDKKLTSSYLKEKLKDKRIPIKTALLDQSIICGIGNIYDDEILFKSQINPNKKSNTLTSKELEKIIDNTKTVLEKAIELGGSTIHSYEATEGITGRFQNQLQVHTHENDPCPVCGTTIKKIKINGRGTYYCPKCQK